MLSARRVRGATGINGVHVGKNEPDERKAYSKSLDPSGSRTKVGGRAPPVLLLLGRRLFRFLCFLGCFLLLALGCFVLPCGNRSVDSVDIDFLDASLAGNRNIVGVNQLSFLPLELVGLDRPVWHFLERSRASSLLRDFCLFLESSLAFCLSRSPSRLGGRACLRCRLRCAFVVRARSLCAGDGGGSGDGDGHGYHFQHASSSRCLTAARVDRGSWPAVMG